MMRFLLCAAALVVFGSPALGERIDPMLAEAVRNVHTDTVSLSVSFNRPPDLTSDRIGLSGQSNPGYPTELFQIDNYAGDHESFRVRSIRLFFDSGGAENQTTLLPWTPIDYDMRGSTLSFDVPYSLLNWTDRNFDWGVLAREAGAIGTPFSGSYRVAAPEPSSAWILATALLCVVFHRLYSRRSPCTDLGDCFRR